jgi:hypothetical protein
VRRRVDHLIPRQADEALRRELNELKQILQKNTQSNNTPAPGQDEIVRYARTVFDDAATLYRASVGGSTIDDNETIVLDIGVKDSTLERIAQWTSSIDLPRGDSESRLSGSASSLFSHQTTSLPHPINMAMTRMMTSIWRSQSKPSKTALLRLSNANTVMLKKCCQTLLNSSRNCLEA